MEKIIKILHEGNYSCVVESCGEVHTFSGHGVSDLYDMIKNKSGFLKKASIADKVVGKAAAALMILGGIQNVYADVISHSAVILLRESGIEPNFGKIVPNIQNRNQTDWCPLEKICYQEKTAESILPLIEKFIAKMKGNNENMPLTAS